MVHLIRLARAHPAELLSLAGLIVLTVGVAMVTAAGGVIMLGVSLILAGIGTTRTTEVRRR